MPIKPALSPATAHRPGAHSRPAATRQQRPGLNRFVDGFESVKRQTGAVGRPIRSPPNLAGSPSPAKLMSAQASTASEALPDPVEAARKQAWLSFSSSPSDPPTAQFLEALAQLPASEQRLYQLRSDLAAGKDVSPTDDLDAARIAFARIIEQDRGGLNELLATEQQRADFKRLPEAEQDVLRSAAVHNQAHSTWRSGMIELAQKAADELQAALSKS